MTTQFDASIGLKQESAYGTYIAPDAFHEFIEEDLDRTPTYSQGAAMRYGLRAPRADRKVLVKEEVGGSFTVEALTSGLGALFEAALGTGTSTVIGATTGYQQLFTPTDTDPLPSYTIQKAIPTVGGGASQPMSFLGMVCSGFELSAANSATPTLKFNWVGKGVDTAEAFVTPSYPSGQELLSFVHGSIRIGGTVTVPSASALSSGGTDAANILDVSLNYDNGLDSGGFFLGGAGQRGRKPALGRSMVSGTITAEYDSNTLRDAYLNDTELALVLTFAHPTAIDTGVYPTLEFVVPIVRLTGEVPKVNGGQPVTQSIPFEGLVRDEAQIYVAIVTAETSI